MEGKLIKTDGSYCLTITHERIGNMIIATDNKDLNKMLNYPYNLSLKNCQAIENGYDLDDLVYNELKKIEILNDDQLIGFEMGLLFGFQKVLSILGDKKFSESDMKKAMNKIVNSTYINQDLFIEIHRKKYMDEYIPSLYQTDWDVEIVMESNLHIGEVVDESYPKDFPLERLKLDANGCIILKIK